MQHLCQVLGMHMTRTTPFHPQADGRVERFNRTPEAMLASVVQEDQLDWDLQIPFLMSAYRAYPSWAVVPPGWAVVPSGRPVVPPARRSSPLPAGRPPCSPVVPPARRSSPLLAGRPPCLVVALGSGGLPVSGGL